MSGQRAAAIAWRSESLQRLEAERARSGQTPLRKFPLPPEWGIDLYLKDESMHLTGSLKHRLARALITDAVLTGRILEGTPLIEASSGSTAVSEAYFAKLLGLPFIAVIPKGTSTEKVSLIEEYGGTCHFVATPSRVSHEATELAEKLGGYFVDQFSNAATVVDWRGEESLASDFLNQMRFEPFPVPASVVVGAGTGGTSVGIAKYLRYCGHATEVVVVDPEGSAFYQAWVTGDRSVEAAGSRIEGIGRPLVEVSFTPEVIDRMLCVPDSASVAGMRILADRAGINAGPSSGTNLWGALNVIQEMRKQERKGSVVMLVCDRGDRYLDTFHSEEWLESEQLEPGGYLAAMERFLSGGQLV
ncbi:MAG TPA: PLP-dependent cysteine synthase family protein [Actinomycetales bacterium]|nr:PLP-dependent cysteine synthase family protein [Actinomycetales bacterium]